ncbi:MAG TPA: IPT/TIG domain-containing protein [Saprospiraceae bacterium]|nr:IPT/TIG domain-containing protein [Saprospiraceae bacterium]
MERRINKILGAFLLCIVFFCACDTPAPNEPAAPQASDDSCHRDILFSPDSGMVGWRISLTGERLGESPDPITVFFGTQLAFVDSVFNGRVVVTVPYIDTGRYTIHVFIGQDTVRSSLKKFHVVTIPLYDVKGVEVEISNLIGTHTIHYWGTRGTIDSVGLHNFKLSTSGTVRKNTKDRFLVADTFVGDWRTEISGEVIFSNPNIASSIILSYWSLNLNPDIASRKYYEIHLRNLPPFMETGDGALQAIVTGSNIGNYVTSIISSSFTWEFDYEDTNDEGLHDITGYADDAKMIITIRR